MDAQRSIGTATFVGVDDWTIEYREKANSENCDLELLTYGIYRMPTGGAGVGLAHAGKEALLFCTAGAAEATIDGAAYRLDHYDVLYVPLGAVYNLKNVGEEPAELVVCQAPAGTTHPVWHARWDEVSKNEKRIRHLKGKDVFLMFDVSEPADKLIAGYTIYEPHTRAWPPHNHTDQEEIYMFPKGHGAMEVYADEETKSFVTSVGPGDAVTIPLLTYHPVFSQDEELHFIWCIAGERYWVGDKNSDFMKGKGVALTT
jgi:mannose-6-phosphate isomerase-like protein (cupin superfamily)